MINNLEIITIQNTDYLPINNKPSLDLPEEVVTLIFSYGDLYDLTKISQVSKKLNSISMKVFTQRTSPFISSIKKEIIPYLPKNMFLKDILPRRFEIVFSKTIDKTEQPVYDAIITRYESLTSEKLPNFVTVAIYPHLCLLPRVASDSSLQKITALATSVTLSIFTCCLCMNYTDLIPTGFFDPYVKVNRKLDQNEEFLYKKLMTLFKSKTTIYKNIEQFSK